MHIYLSCHFTMEYHFTKQRIIIRLQKFSKSVVFYLEFLYLKHIFSAHSSVDRVLDCGSRSQRFKSSWARIARYLRNIMKHPYRRIEQNKPFNTISKIKKVTYGVIMQPTMFFVFY